MQQLKGYEVPGNEHAVCQLLHALYSLKKLGREWYHHFCDTMMALGFTFCQTKYAMFHCYKDEDTLIVAVDINDLMMAGNMRQAISMFKQQLGHRFKIKDLGGFHWLLGIEVT